MELVTCILLKGTMTVLKYMGILRSNLKASAQKFGLKTSFVFQQNNYPKNTAHKTREWLFCNAPLQLKILSESSEIPIENLYSINWI